MLCCAVQLKPQQATHRLDMQARMAPANCASVIDANRKVQNTVKMHPQRYEIQCSSCGPCLLEGPSGSPFSQRNSLFQDRQAGAHKGGRACLSGATSSASVTLGLAAHCSASLGRASKIAESAFRRCTLAPHNLSSKPAASHPSFHALVCSYGRRGFVCARQCIQSFAHKCQLCSHSGQNSALHCASA